MSARQIAAVALGVSVLALATPARAFPTGTQFDDDALATDGAGGIPFTGAPRWAGHTCAVCHTEAPGAIHLRLEADRPELFTDGYDAARQYHLRVVLEDEHAAVEYAASGDRCGELVEPYHPCDQNGFSLEIDNVLGQPTGTLSAFAGTACVTGAAPTDADARILSDGTAATHSGAHMAMTAWDLCWTAPATGTGPVTAYLAAVDGNGGNGTAAFPTDVLGDDVASGAVPIAEQNGPSTGTQTGGCNAAGADDLSLPALALVLALVHAARRRRRALTLALALATAPACVHVKAHQRETLARKNMKFAPDPTEDELDLHMQEAREGSQGGYGSSGGGCGCN